MVQVSVMSNVDLLNMFIKIITVLYLNWASNTLKSDMFTKTADTLYQIVLTSLKGTAKI